MAIKFGLVGHSKVKTEAERLIEVSESPIYYTTLKIEDNTLIREKHELLGVVPTQPYVMNTPDGDVKLDELEFDTFEEAVNYILRNALLFVSVRVFDNEPQEVQ